jgi:hypothetical protein
MLAWPGALRAGYSIHLKSAAGEAVVEAESRQGRVWVDLIQLTRGLGGAASLKDGEYVLTFSSGTSVVNPQSKLYRARKTGEKKWKASGLIAAPMFAGTRFMVGLEDVPALTFRTFTYHLQKRLLTEDSALPSGAKDRRQIPARLVYSSRKEWISLEDAARALGVALFTARPRTYNLVLPDFSILEVSVGDTWVYRRNEKYKPLEDPVFLFSGAPYATLSTLRRIFDADLQWDADNGALIVPLRYGPLKDRPLPERLPLTVVGYMTKPLRLSLDEAALFYQDPGPTYPADHPDVYESVRDFLTNAPTDPGTRGIDRMSGNALVNTGGSLLGRPMEGGARIEKTGTRGSLMNGSLQWGFPGAQVKISREYAATGDFFNQFDLVDQVQVSHSNNAYGEGKANPSWEVKAVGGRDLFNVFVSTDFFSQTVGYYQRFAGTSLDGRWNRGRHVISWGLSATRYHNDVRRIANEYNLFGDLYGDNLVVDVEPAEAKALASQVLTDHHDAAVGEASYQAQGLGRLDVAQGVSRWRDPEGRRETAGDRRVAGTLGDKGTRVAVSHERIDADYRAAGDPTRYQNRSVTRVSPTLDLASPWKITGEFLREDFLGSDLADTPAYRNDSLFLTNSLSFRKYDLNATASMFNNTLYGKRWSAGLDQTQRIGKDSIQEGVSWASQWFGSGPLYRQSYTGRLGGQIQRSGWKISVGEELTRHHYPFYKLDAWKSIFPQFPNRWESQTYAQGRWGKWEGAVQYNVAPRYYREAEILHTGYARFGYRLNDKKAFNVFGALTSLNQSLNSPQVWRAGIEYVNDFF